MRLHFTRWLPMSVFVSAIALACGDDGPGDAQPDAGPDFADGGSCAVTCGSQCCESGEFCALEARCAPTQKPCATADDCWFDSYCHDGTCVPYEVPPDKTHDETCKVTIDIGAIVPAEQCRWTGPPAGDAFPDHVHVMATPVVVDLDFDGDPRRLSPSIVFPSFPTVGHYEGPGVLRIIRGTDCTQQDSLNDPADAVMAPAPVAVGDIDGDGRAEIVAMAHGGGVIAFKLDPATKKFARLWRSGTCTGGVPPAAPDTTGESNKWSGPSIYDLDDDGAPEILLGGTVYGANGCLKSTDLGFPAYSVGVVPVVADVDEDGKMELVLGDGVYEWTGGTWVREAYFTGTQALGHVAVADLGNFPLASQGGADRAEIVVITNGEARVTTIEGTTVFGPVPLPGAGKGGPPTIADFDGDGRREFASAGGGAYAVFDLDCVAGGDPAKCGGQSKTDGVLWSQPSQDNSSNVTGSSVFDFDANGSAEAVYADECFLRIYEGATGKVLYSVARSSGTTYENPVIVDADGDYRTEIVSAVNDYSPHGCPASDPLSPATAYSDNHGIVVLRDQNDRWAPSRPVWNQHAYSVTHVGNLGETPRSSLVQKNFRDPTLNNFRQNVQGGLEAFGEPDLTAGGSIGAVRCQGSLATFEARVCNRGTLPMVSGTEVTFYEGSKEGPVLCSTPVPLALNVGECQIVSCQAELGSRTIDVFVLVDPKSVANECHENNNAAIYRGVACGQIPR